MPKTVREYIDHEDYLLQQALSKRKPKKKTKNPNKYQRISSMQNYQQDPVPEEEEPSSNEPNIDITEFPGNVSGNYPTYNMRNLNSNSTNFF